MKGRGVTPSGPRPATQKQKEAQELIDKFAKDLRALNDGKAIPAQWKNYLLHALTLKPERQKRGRKSDYEKIAAIAKECALKRDSLFELDRTPNDRREAIKAEIATNAGVSIRKVERVIAKIKLYFAKMAYEEAIATLNYRGAPRLEPEDIRKAQELVRNWEAEKKNLVDKQTTEAITNGIAAAICEEMTADNALKKAPKTTGTP